MEYYKKNEFYKDGGTPTESFEYNVPERRGYTHSRNKKGFAYVSNSLPVYSRLQTWEGGSLYPCGLMKEPATDGYWAKLSDSERDELCPKVAYGFSAFLLNYCSLEEDDGEVYLQPLYCKRSDLYKEYQKRCYQVYRLENEKKYERYQKNEKMEMVAELDKTFWETHVRTEMGLLKKLSRKHIPKALYAEIKSWAQAYVDEVSKRCYNDDSKVTASSEAAASHILLEYVNDQDKFNECVPVLKNLNATELGTRIGRLQAEGVIRVVGRGLYDMVCDFFKLEKNDNERRYFNKARQKEYELMIFQKEHKENKVILD